jgi:hypothetical protein
MEHARTTYGGETVGGSSGSGELSTGRRSAEMITNGRSDTNRKVLIKRRGEHLLPTAQACGLGGHCLRQRLQTPEAVRYRSVCYLPPGQASITQLHRRLSKPAQGTCYLSMSPTT